MTAGSGVFKVSIFIRNQGENHPNSMDVLEKAHLDPFTYQEILLLLQSHDLFKQELKGKWFWLKGEGLHKYGRYTIDAQGELVNIMVGVSYENIVRINNGKYPHSLLLRDDDSAAKIGFRYSLDASSDPITKVATVVLGKPKPEWAVTQQNAAEQARLLRVEEEVERGSTIRIISPSGERTLEAPNGATIHLHM